MDIKEIKKAKKDTEARIKEYIQIVMDNFKKETEEQIDYISIDILNYKIRDFLGEEKEKIFKVDKVTCSIDI